MYLLDSLVDRIWSQLVSVVVLRRQEPLFLWKIKSLHSGDLLEHLIAQEVTDPVVSEVGSVNKSAGPIFGRKRYLRKKIRIIIKSALPNFVRISVLVEHQGSMDRNACGFLGLT